MSYWEENEDHILSGPQGTIAQDRVDVDVYIKYETDKAILIRDDEDIEHWLPKSLIEYEGDVGDTTTIDMPEWLAIEKGLG